VVIGAGGFGSITYFQSQTNEEAMMRKGSNRSAMMETAVFVCLRLTDSGDKVLA